MKRLVLLFETRRTCQQKSSRGWSVGILSPLLLLILGWQQIAVGQSDDFNDGNDTGWKLLDLTVVGSSATRTFPDDGFGGKAYRILSPAPPVPNAGPARAFSYQTNIYDNFYAAVDVVTWDNSLNQAFGFLARASDIGLGKTDGYVLNYDPNQRSGGRGQFQINVVTAELPTTLAAANVSLDPSRRYRFVMTGLGSTMVGEIYDFSDLTAPLVTIVADDTTYSAGILGLFEFSRVGAADYTNPTTGKADVTFDNYFASATGPQSVDGLATPHPVPDMPQVIRRSPGPRENFYGYTNGINFAATTLTTNLINTNAVKLYLNGAEVSSRLSISGGATNLEVTFNGLAPQMVYDGRIVLSDFSSRTTTNEFTFDTFDENFFTAPGVKVIEAEDYNYDGGQYQDNPPPSGLDDIGNRIPADGSGYYGRAGTPGIDYFDYSTTPGSGATAEYRDTDLVGTQAGSVEIENTAGSPVINDTIRQKYVATGLSEEFEVRGTEGGEWLNYTRVFSNASYHVYLREACRAPQSVYLDRVTGDPAQADQTTVRLGAFNVPSTTLLVNYRFVPLSDTNGMPAVVDLASTNTLRLTFGGSQTNATQATMTLNYLVFAPVNVSQLVLESAADVAGQFAEEFGATIDTANRTITVGISGNNHFYRIRSGAPPALTITSVNVNGANVVIGYQ